MTLAVLLFAVISLTNFVHGARFTVRPGDTIVRLNEMINVIFECEVTEGTPYWSLQIPTYMPNSVHPVYLTTEGGHAETDRVLNERGITFFSRTGFTNISIPGVAENNCTTISCVLRISSIAAVLSEPVKLTVVGTGPPLPPDPILTTLLPTDLEVQWGIPYSHENYPVESYNIEIVSTTSSNIQSVLAEVRGYNDTSYNYTFDSKATLFDCHTVTAIITALSASGESEPGTVSRNYPIAPQPFQSEVEIGVKFLSDGSPNVELSFEAPFICDYQTANYTITIEELPSSELPPITRESTYVGSSRMITEMFSSDDGLKSSTNYTLTITVTEEGFETNVTQDINFTTIFDPSVQENFVTQETNFTTIFQTNDPDAQVTIHDQDSGKYNTLSTVNQVIITAVVCSLSFLLVGIFLGTLAYHCATKCTHSSHTPPDATVLYDEVSPAPEKNAVELKENFAYSPVHEVTDN